MPAKPVAKPIKIETIKSPIKIESAKTAPSKPEAAYKVTSVAKPATNPKPASSSGSNPLQNTGKRMEIGGIDTNDPNIVALISVICAMIIQAPGIGYAILGYTRKALIYTVGTWAVILFLILGTFVFSFATFPFGAICVFPLILVIFAIYVFINVFIIYDVYCMAKGERSKLPDF